jgi:hypothetical protein
MLASLIIKEVGMSMVFCPLDGNYVREWTFFFFFFFAVLALEPMVSHRLGKCSTTELHPLPRNKHVLLVGISFGNLLERTLAIFVKVLIFHL